jgi:methionyl-tRNA formyltransferase
MRILFAGSPAIAVPTLAAIARRHSVVGILTNPESEQGRGRAIGRTAVAEAALRIFGAAVPVLAPERLDAGARAAVAALAPDILVTFAYGKIFGPKFLALFPKGGLNVHPSLLPKYRGPSPIQHAILRRDTETGVCVQELALEMDAGSIHEAESLALTGRETQVSLSERCAEIGARLALKTLERIEEGSAAPRPQTGIPSYCEKIAKEDGLIDWSASCLDIDAKVRAFNPWPLAHSFLAGLRLNVFETFPYPQETLPKRDCGTIIGYDRAKGILAVTGDGILAIRTLQFSGRKILSDKDFSNGFRNLSGARLSGGIQDDPAI